MLGSELKRKGNHVHKKEKTMSDYEEELLDSVEYDDDYYSDDATEL